ncbi:MAG TPA: hypothetical protein VF240_18425 [Pyrinomonadaceae bacterium]
MKQAFRLSWSGALALLLLSGMAATSARAQSTSATPDSVVVQIANTAPTPPFTPAPVASPSPTPVPNLNRDTYAQDVSGDGRFVVMESTGDIATERTATRNNIDGNVEIFLFDYAQRRIFQITNTTNALKDAAGSPVVSANIDASVRNLRPMISHDGRYIVFASNAYSDANSALTPKNFDGTANAAALKADGNMEIFLYEIPAVGAALLSSGAEAPQADLVAGTMTRVTFTAASRVATPGTATVAPFVADDNRAATLNDDGSFLAFVSTRNIANVGGASNADANPEIFLWNRTSPSFIQATVTSGAFSFNDNPSLSGDGAVLAFFSTADIGSNETQADRGNGELYAASFNGTTVSNLRQLTRTPNNANGDPVNILSPGRRLSRNGQLLAFESTAVFNSNGSLNGALADNFGIYFVRVADATFTLVGSRAPTGQLVDLLRFPTFTGDSANIVFSSTLNLRATTGEALAEDSADGLNGGTSGDANITTRRRTQVYAVPVPAAGAAPANYQRLTRLPTRFGAAQVFPTDTLNRLAFTLQFAELGGGNSDSGYEAYYLIVPGVTGEASSATVAFSTGASDRPVVSASPAPTPPVVGGLAPGMLGIARSATTLAPSNTQVSQNDATESGANARRPPLPIELNGVTVTVSGYAAGLFFVSPGQLNFVVPPGLLIAAANTSTPVVINNNGTVIRATLALNPAQPDIFTTSNGDGGRAAVLNVTNPCIAAPGEPFTVTTTRPTGGDCAAATTEQVATQLLIMLTGARGPLGTPTLRTEVSVTIGTTTLPADAIVSVGPSRTHGFDQIIVTLPATLAGAGDVPVIVTITKGGVTTSRPADTAPRITIQ